MYVDPNVVALLKWLLLAFLGGIGSVLFATWKLGRRSRDFTDAQESVERIVRLVDGDPKEQERDHIRHGLVGRVKTLESGVSTNARQLRAVLRGIGVSSASDEHAIVEAVRAHLARRGAEHLESIPDAQLPAGAREALTTGQFRALGMVPETPMPPHPMALRPPRPRSTVHREGRLEGESDDAGSRFTPQPPAWDTKRKPPK